MFERDELQLTREWSGTSDGWGSELTECAVSTIFARYCECLILQQKPSSQIGARVERYLDEMRFDRQGNEVAERVMNIRANWACSVHDFCQILRVFNTAMEAKPSGKNLQVVNTAMCSQQPNRSLECWISLMFNTSEEGVEQWQQQLGADELDSGWPTPNMLSLIWYASGEI